MGRVSSLSTERLLLLSAPVKGHSFGVLVSTLSVTVVSSVLVFNCRGFGRLGLAVQIICLVLCTGGP